VSQSKRRWKGLLAAESVAKLQMLYYVLYQQLFPIRPAVPGFGFVTFRTAFASLTALFLCIILGPWLIANCANSRSDSISAKRAEIASKKSRHADDGWRPDHHFRGGTHATMGKSYRSLRLGALLGLVGYGCIGFFDDYSKILQQKNLGLTVKQKFTAQCLMASCSPRCCFSCTAKGIYKTDVNVPFFKQFKPDLLIDSLMTNPWTYLAGAIFFIGFVTVVVVGFSNAVNLTDGLDGLAIG